MSYFDTDGLLRKYGTEKAVPNRAGEFKTFGELREVELKIDLTTLTTSSVIQSDQVFIPSGVRIEEVEVVAQAAATSGGAATLDIGMIQTDRATAVNVAAFVNALALTAIDVQGEKNVLRAPPAAGGAGTLVGLNTTVTGYITARVNTAVYTAGTVVVRIKYKRDV